MSEQETRLTEAMNAFLKEQSLEHQADMMKAMQGYTFFVPGVFPEGVDMSTLKPGPGGKVVLTPDKRPVPAVIRNNKGEMYVPAYTSAKDIKGDPKPPVVLQMPFFVMVELTARNQTVEGIAVNPFQQNILLKRPALQRILLEAKNAGKRTVQEINPRLAYRLKAETEVLPKALYRDAGTFMDRLEQEEGSFLVELYRTIGDCPYAEDRFSVMALNIRDELTLIRLDLPEEKLKGARPLRAYILYDAAAKRAAYYTIETTPEPGGRVVVHTGADGKREAVSEGPTEGNEISRVLELFDENDTE